MPIDQLVDLIRNLPLLNLDLLAVAVTIAAIAILGTIVYISDRKNITNQSFLYFAIVTVLWSSVNYLSYQTTVPDLVLWLLRLVVFLGVWHSFTFFRFLFVFPERTRGFPWFYHIIIVPLTLCVSILTLTPAVFSGIAQLSQDGSVSKTVVGKGMYLFVSLVVFLIIAAVVILSRKTIRAKKEERKAYLLVLIGAIFTFALLFTFNLILPGIFLNVRFIPLGALFIFPFIAFTSYAILKHKLFNIKVAATGVLVFVLAVVTFLEIIFSDTSSLMLFRGGVFLLVLTIGILLIRSVFREVDQREKIEKLAQELTQKNDELYVANERLKELDMKKTEFVSIASHQLRSPLTAIKGYSSMILEGSFGPIQEQAKEAVHRIFESSQRLVVVIEDFLNVTRIELGKMKYEVSDFDLNKLAKTITTELKPVAARRNLKITYKAPRGDCMVHADFGKTSQAVQNLIDNAIKYTEPGGKIDVSITKVDGKTRFAAKDTGIGISKEGMGKLFEKFSRAEDGTTINAIGTGLGLYVARQIVEAQGGKIWAESEGAGKGSTFFLEF